VTRSSRTSSGVLLAIGAAVLFAVNGNVSKVALQNGVSSLELVSVRSAGTALILLGITALSIPSALRVGWRELGFLALWVRFVQKQPVKSRLWLGLALALGGLALVAQLWKGMTLDPVGLISAIGAGASLACYYLMGEHGQRQRDPISLMGFSFGFSAILWAVVSPWWTFPFSRLTRTVDLPGALPGHAPLWLMVLWIIVLGTVVPFLLVLLAVGRLGAARVGLIGMLEPVGAGVIAWVLLGESLNTAQVVGSFIVLVGIVLAETARQGSSPLPEGMAP
jgi:drug/metabolite transporter (DMT)-like permease